MRLGRTVQELLESVSSAELTEWYAYYAIEPFDAQRDDLRAAIVASTVANVAPRRKGSRTYKTEDFLPYRPPVSAAALRASLAHLVKRKDSGHKD